MLILVHGHNTAMMMAFKVDPNATFRPGMIAQLKVINGDVVLGISDGRAPLGIIDDVKNEQGDSTCLSGKVHVWSHRGVFKTDQIEDGACCLINANLYCSERGFLTTRKPSPQHPCVGMVLGYERPEHSNPVLEFMWS
jgi:hypothetical protein